MEEFCISVGKTEIKFQTFHTCNLFFSTLLSGPNLIISWAKLAVGLTRTNVWTLFSTASILTREGKKGKINNVALPKMKLNVICREKASYRVVKFKNTALTNVQLHFLLFIKSNCGQTVAENSLQHCSARKTEHVKREGSYWSWFPLVHQAH